MNWIKTKVSELKEKTKKVLKKMPSFSEIQSSPWISTECGPVLKSDLKKNFFKCPKCNKMVMTQKEWESDDFKTKWIPRIVLGVLSLGIIVIAFSF